MVAATSALLLPALPRACAAALRRKCEHNLRQLALAAHNYHDTFARFPPGMDAQYVGAPIRLLEV